jgi:hypothetical protein
MPNLPQGGDTEPQVEALFDCKGWTIEMASLYARDVDLNKKRTGVAKKFGREVEVSNVSRGLSNPGSNWAAPCRDRLARPRHRAPALRRAGPPSGRIREQRRQPLRGVAVQREIKHGLSKRKVRSTPHYDRTATRGVE